MKLTIHVKENKAAFFLELLRSFKNFVTIENMEKDEPIPSVPDQNTDFSDSSNFVHTNTGLLGDWEEAMD